MRETNERGRRHEIRKISIDVGHVALIAIRRRTLIIFYYRHSPRDNSMFTGQKKTTSYFTSPYFVPTTHPLTLSTCSFRSIVFLRNVAHTCCLRARTHRCTHTAARNHPRKQQGTRRGEKDRDEGSNGIGSIVEGTVLLFPDEDEGRQEF